jgi:hypothetical protein
MDGIVGAIIPRSQRLRLKRTSQMHELLFDTVHYWCVGPDAVDAVPKVFSSCGLSHWLSTKPVSCEPQGSTGFIPRGQRIDIASQRVLLLQPELGFLLLPQR